MKKLFFLFGLLLLTASCDPTSLMDVTINNSTSQKLRMTFVSNSLPGNTLSIDPDQTVLFDEGMSTTGSFLEPSFAEYDSIYISNEANEILKVYKQDSEGKNIYQVDTYWTYTEPSKRQYRYVYRITKEELE